MSFPTEPTNRDSVILLRDVAAWISYHDFLDEYRPANYETGDSVEVDGVDYTEDYESLLALRALHSEAKNYGYDSVLIAESYFTEYARQLADDMCQIEDEWPYTCIDWDKAANVLKQDYSEVDFDGVTYFLEA